MKNLIYFLLLVTLISCTTSPPTTNKLDSQGEDVRNSIKRRLPHFRYCIEKYIDQNPRTNNLRIILNITIGPQGKATKSMVNGADLNNKTKDCINKIVKTTQFTKPPLGSPANISMPINFVSGR